MPRYVGIKGQGIIGKVDRKLDRERGSIGKIWVGRLRLFRKKRLLGNRARRGVYKCLVDIGKVRHTQR